jgi:hypothetical protein
MSNSTPAAELAELARAAAWGLAKGGHLDSLEDGKGALVERLNVLEAAERAGIHIDLDGECHWPAAPAQCRPRQDD